MHRTLPNQHVMLQLHHPLHAVLGMLQSEFCALDLHVSWSLGLGISLTSYCFVDRVGECSFFQKCVLGFQATNSTGLH